MGSTPTKNSSNRITQETKDRIFELLLEEHSQLSICRELGVSLYTVSKIATEFNVSNTNLARSEESIRLQQQRATKRRMQLKLDLLDDIDHLRDRAWSEYTKVVLGKDGPVELVQELPPLDQVRNAYSAIGIALDGYYKLDSMDSGANIADSGRTLLVGIMEDLGKFRSFLEEEGVEPVADPASLVAKD